MMRRPRNFLQRKVAAALAALLLLLPTSVATAAPNDQTVTKSTLSGELTVLSNRTPEEMQPYEDMFTRQYPDTSIEYIYLENYDQQAYERILSGDYGDVLFIPGSLPDEDCEKYFDVLGDYSELSDTYNFLEQSKRDGSKIYGLPSSAYVNGFVYNKRVFEQAGITQLPQTPEEFLTDLGYIASYTQATPFYTNYISDWALSVWENFPYIEMTGSADYKANIFIGIKNPFTTAGSHQTVYTLLYDIVANNLCEPIGTGDWEASKAQLNNGEIGCVAIGSWALQQFKQADSHSNDVAFMPFPYNIDGTQYVSISADYCYAVNKNSKQRELAHAYVTFMLEESGYALNSDTLSILKTDPYPDGYENLEQAILLSPGPPSPKNNNTYSILSSGLNLSDGKEQKRIIEAASGMSDETLEDIFADWDVRWEASRTPDMLVEDTTTIFSTDTVTAFTSEVTLSSAETDFVREHPTLTVGYLRQFAPFQFEQDGTFTGISYSLCEMIQKQSGIAFTYKAYASYEELLQALDNGEIDMIAGIEKSSAFSLNMQLSREYANSMIVVIKNTTAQLEGIEQKRVAATTGNELDYFRNLTNTVEAASLPEALSLVNTLHADYTVTNYYSANYYTRELQYNNVTILPTGTESSICLGFPKDADTRFIAICNKCIYNIPDGQMELMLLDHMEPSAQDITLGMLIRLYPIQFIAGISLFFLFVVLFLVWLSYERKKMARTRELDAKRYHILASLADEYVFEYSYEKDCLSFDEKCKKVFSFAGTICPETFANDHPDAQCFIEKFKQLRDSNTDNNIDFQFPEASGQTTWYRLITAKIRNEKGQPIQMIGKIVNIQEEMLAHQQLLAKAERDPLTGIFNREGFQSIYQKLSAQQTAGSYVLGMLDLDNFKSVNDSLGHAGGDLALKLLADELSSVIGSHGIVSRYGGDEFMLYLPEVTSEDAVIPLLAELVSNMHQTITFDGRTHTLSISLGAAWVPAQTTYEDAFTLADKTLYDVKEHGKNNYHLSFFNS